jgi:hypothetical protein
VAEREYLIANPKPKRERKPKAQIEEPDAQD